MTPRILIVAGSDSGGGAGIQADIRTVTMLGGHAMTAITAITAQNTLGVQAVMPVPAEMVVAQMRSCLDDIGVDAIKIGMIGSAGTAHAVAEVLADIDVPIVFDPVMVATSGSALADTATIAAFGRLMALATVTTPNLPELEVLTGTPPPPVRAQPVEARVPNASGAPGARPSTSSRRAEMGGCEGANLSGAILVKGGHGDGDTLTDRLLIDGVEQARWFSARIASTNTHGTGCTLASAIAVGLACGLPLVTAIEQARMFVRLAIHDAPGLGQGHGPMGHQRLRQDVAHGRAGLNQVTLPATDYAASRDFYDTLGLTRIVDAAPRYARYETTSGATLSIEAADELDGVPLLFLECDDLDAEVARLQGKGVTFDQLPTDMPWAWREARLRDPAGNRLCLYQAGEMRRFPPWRLA